MSDKTPTDLSKDIMINGIPIKCMDPVKVETRKSLPADMAAAMGYGFQQGIGFGEDGATKPELRQPLAETMAWKCRHLLVKARRLMKRLLKVKTLCAVFSNGSLVPILPSECKSKANIITMDFVELSSIYENISLPVHRIKDLKELAYMGYSLFVNYRWALNNHSSSYAKGYARAMLKLVATGYPYPDGNKCDTCLYPVEAPAPGQTAEPLNGQYIISWPNRPSLSLNVVDLGALNLHMQTVEEARERANSIGKENLRLDCMLPVPVAMIDLNDDIHWELPFPTDPTPKAGKGICKLEPSDVSTINSVD